MKYQVIDANSAKELARKVHEELAKGWELQGGVSTYVPSNSYFPSYCQAMVKRKSYSLQLVMDGERYANE